MKFVKANLDLLITALVVVLAIGAYFFIIGGSWKEELIKQSSERAKKEGVVNGFLYDKRKPLVIPGIGNIPGANDPATLKVTPMPNLSAIRKQIQDRIRDEADKLIKEASRLNWHKRAEVKAGPRQTEFVVPLLAEGTIRADNLLPMIKDSTDALAFRDHYLHQFDSWQAKLGYAPPTVGVSREGAGAASDALRDQIQRAIKEQTDIAAKNAAASGGVAPAPGSGVGLSPEQKAKIARSVISQRALRIKLYLDDNAIQKREWAKGSVPPTENQVFEGLVDSWLINDVVNATAEINKSSSSVGTSPITRIESIVVGGSGGLLTPPSNSGNTGMGGMAPPPGAGPGGGTMMMNAGGAGYTGGGGSPIDLAKSMTGHVGDAVYVVVPMKIVVYIDPAHVNRFMEELYKQNNGYTWLNTRITVVDPLEAASNGYLYGTKQVIRAEFTVENILFRKWIDPIVPLAMRPALGIPMPTVTK